MKLRLLAAMTAAALVGTPAFGDQAQQHKSAAQKGANGGQSPTVLSAQPQYTESMQKLRTAAQRLRESIQAAARKPPGKARDIAIDEAHEALLDTQRAMIALPPELRTTGTKVVQRDGKQAQAGKQSGDAQMQAIGRLDKASDRLLGAIDAMERQQAGERRQEAIAFTHEALWDTYEAMLAMPVSAKRGGKVAANTGQSSGNGGSGHGAGAKGDGASERQESAQSGKQKGRRQGGQETVSVLLVPIQVAANEQLNDGCWARIYENRNFGGSHLTVVGPAEVAHLDRSVAGDWNGADSIVTGAKATVTVYDDEEFEERSGTIRPRQRVADLKDVTQGIFDTAESLKVTCTG